MAKKSQIPEELPPTFGKQEIKYAFESGLTRRVFLQTTGLSMLLAAKPAAAQLFMEGGAENQSGFTFEQHQVPTLRAVQMQLFPEDSDGPSAEDLRSFEYLLWAMEDPDNIADGDPEFIGKGITRLQEVSISSHARPFLLLSFEERDQVLRLMTNTRFGENWISLLLYYLMESLTLDPIYSGNPGGIGWQWLEHQPGFPGPVKPYRDFL